MTTTELNVKLLAIKDLLQNYKRVVVAYSGGTDSVLLLKIAVETLSPQNVIACIGVSESLAASEYQHAIELAETFNVETVQIHPKEMMDENYRQNSAKRCYYCKSQLYGAIRRLAEQRKIKTIVCGDNADDIGDYRPGMQAAKDFDIKAPLLEAGLTKDQVRRLSKQLNLPTWNKPAQPCLASRIPYGLEISPQRLSQIEQGEEFLRSILPDTPLRVRHHDQLVRIEVPAEYIPKLAETGLCDKIVVYFKSLGFKYITLDLQGFRSGSANEVL